MSRQTDRYFSGIPMKSYDLLKEGLIMMMVIAAIIVVLAIIFGSPDYTPVRSQDVAARQPVAYLKTCAKALAGQSGIEGYGPPYTPDTDNAQDLFGVVPSELFGVTIPIHPAEDFVIAPLRRLAILDEKVDSALNEYLLAPPPQQKEWAAAYLGALDKAAFADRQVNIPAGEYGPVPALMDGMLALGKAGLLEGALESGPSLPYTMNFTKSLLFFQDDVDHGVARSLDMLGEQWGISHETGPYPGAWWLWPYTFLYQIPPMSVSPNGDLQAAAIMMVVFLIMLLVPFIPVLNRIPRWIGVHRIIWRDWYQRMQSKI